MATTMEIPVTRDYHDARLEAHAQKVRRVAQQLRAYDGTAPLSLRKKAVPHQVPKRNDKTRNDRKIDIGNLDQILEIDTEAMTCTAEPGVTFEDLVAVTLKYGLVPMVVPELKTITIGGAVSGCSLESMSFKIGGFHDTCLEYEVITATGDVLRCTPDNENALVHQMMHGSFGTLGILSKLKFRLTPAKRFVRLEHHKFTTLADYKAAIESHYRAKDVDFMDGIIHSPSLYVLCLGTFVDQAPYTNRYDWLKVYYVSTAQRTEDYLETQHYFFRYDNGVTNVHPKSLVGRFLVGKFMHSSQLLRLAEKLHRFLPEEHPDVTVDLFIPFSRLDEFLHWYGKSFEFKPLWVVPYKRVRDYEWISNDFFAGIDDEMFIDIAIYGLKQRAGRNYYREIEEELARINGIKTLISHNFYGEDEFWKIWNRKNYDAVKSITDPKNLFRDLYTKTCKAYQGLE
jgi:FAD/FMN-containing dehydrogenase